MDLLVKEILTSSVTEHPVLEVIENRRSLRAYADKPVEPSKIDALFEAARWAPSSMNEQPWFYIYATKDQPELWQRICDSLMEGNRLWAANAPLLIVSLARKKHLRNDRPNGSAKYDLGAANAFLSLQATALGLNVHQMGGYDREKLVYNLGIPVEDYELGVVMAIGYPGHPEELPENLKQRELAPRSRHTIQGFVLNRSFNHGNE
jgi:nitroreductase